MDMLGNNNMSSSHDHHHHQVDQNGSPPGGGDCGGGGDGLQLKKGPWTAAEDAVLTEYVRKHGEGNWNAVQRNTGLARCGKSCRLRWANHLRPNLKKGAFSPDEERLIVELHAQLGNKWARMAAQLPGRTDNEIKNYWNTRVKRRHRQGLPLYPPEIQSQQHGRPHYQQQLQDHHHHHQQQQQQQQTPQSSQSHQSQSHQSPASTPSTPTPTSSFSFHTTQTTPTAAHQHYQHHHHNIHQFSRSPTPNCLSPTPPPPLSPSSALHSPHHHQHPHSTLPTLSLFDSTTNPTNLSTAGCSKTSSFSPFNIHRAPPTLQTPLRFKRFHADTTSSAAAAATTTNPTTNFNANYNNDHNHNNYNNSFNTNTYQTSSFSLPFSTFLRSPTSPTCLSTPQQPNCNTYSNTNSSRLMSSSMQPSPYSSNLQVPFGSNNSSSSSILRTQFEKDYSSSNNNNNFSTNSSVFALKPELPSSQLLFSHNNHNGNSAELAFVVDNDQKLSLSGGGSGLLDDLLDETNNHVSFMEDKRDFNGFNHWSGDSSSLHLSPGLRPKEEEIGADQINDSNNAMHEDLSRLFSVINNPNYNNSMQVPVEWYSDTTPAGGGEASSNGGHSNSVITDDNLSLEMQQIASMFRVDSSSTQQQQHVRSTSTPGSCSLDNLPGIC
ncbi:hypothetical protein ACOSQ3_030897 [Xanthoceras sorbifolium]